MNAVDLADYMFHFMVLVIMSWNWQLYFIVAQFTIAVNLSYNAHVMLVEWRQQQGGEFIGAPLSRREFREKLGLMMMQFILTGEYCDMGESPRKKQKKQQADQGGSVPPPPSVRLDNTTLASAHQPVRHNKVLLKPDLCGKWLNAKQRCAYCNRKSALHRCPTCNVFLHASTASNALKNTTGQEWRCFAEYHTHEGHKASYEYYQAEYPRGRKNRPKFDVPESAAKTAERTSQFAHNKKKN